MLTQTNASMNILIVIQARSGSSRLPNKVMLPLAGRPLLQRMVERVQLATTFTQLVVATTLEPRDNPIRELCEEIGIPCFSGHPTDLLDRHYKAGLEHRADVVVKIPSDCPLIDPMVIDKVISFWIAHRSDYDYVSNLHPTSWPDGQDVEVIPMNVLKSAWKNATKEFEREHTTPWIWDNPTTFRVGNVAWHGTFDYSKVHRWTIDYLEDYEFIKGVYDALWKPENPGFGVDEILNYVERHPELFHINSNYAGRIWYEHHLNELKTIGSGHSLQSTYA